MGRCETGVQIHRTDQCFKGIRKNRSTLAPPGFDLAFTESQIFGQLQTQSQLVQGVLFDQIGTDTREVTFCLAIESVVQQTGHRQIQYRIT